MLIKTHTNALEDTVLAQNMNTYELIIETEIIPTGEYVIVNDIPDDFTQLVYDGEKYGKYLTYNQILNIRYNNEINGIKQWFCDTDHLAIKNICGDLDEDSPQYVEYLRNRKENYARINEIETLITQPMLQKKKR